jgi:hypothetical protein
VNAHAGGVDAFVAKLNSNGAKQWHTFMGSSFWDHGFAIAVDGSGQVYVAGSSESFWGSPVDPGEWPYDTFVAKLDSSGARQWHTFMGSSVYQDYGRGIALDGSGNVYVTGYSNATWGSPVNAHAGGTDAFVAKLDSSGARQWNTFMGSSSIDIVNSIAVDGSGNVYVAGLSTGTWGSPVNVYEGGTDAFIAKLNNSGARQWNTFMGSSSSDGSNGIAVDGSGNVYVTGNSNATWGSPVNAHAGGADAFVAKLNSSGTRQWNTFMGSSSSDSGSGIAVNDRKNVYVAGTSSATWGSSVNPYAGGEDAFVAKLSSVGAMPWNLLLLED